VSVITPVYNAETTVSRAVLSAVNLVEVGEILLIDDAGPDNAAKVCRELAAEYPKVRLLAHPDGGNHGAGASRNLGIAEAQFPYIAFLDADDYYLPNRFTKDREVLSADDTIDGVYGGTGIDYEDEAARERFHAAGYSYQEFTTLSAPVSSEDLFAVMFYQHPFVSGEFTTDAITVRKSLLDKVGAFHTGLRLQQDTHLWRRLAAAGSLVSGIIEQPIAIRGVHARNRMTDQIEQEKFLALWWESLIRELQQIGLSRERWRMVRKTYAGFLAKRGKPLSAMAVLLHCVADQPSLFNETYGFFDLTFLEIFHSSKSSNRVISAKNRFLRILRK
jgi:hypothetical protein